MILLFRLFLILLALIGTASSQCSNASLLHMGLAGDVMLGRMVNEKIRQTSLVYPWGNVLPLLRAQDLNLVNLETTFTLSDRPVPKVFNFKSDPAHVRVLEEGHISVVNLANNHILDFGVQGLVDTLNALNTAGIAHVGAGMNLPEAKRPVIISKKGITVGIIGYTDNEPGWVAGPDKPGVNYIKVGDTATIKKDITQLRPQVDVVIVTIHWGPNFIEHPTPEFIDFAHRIIDAGADIIHGHSAHIFQAIEEYKGKLIFYNTGDFVDDYMVHPQERNDQSFYYVLEIDSKGAKKLNLIPVIISDMQVNKAPVLQAEQILQRMISLCAYFNTPIAADGIWERTKAP